MGLVSRQVEAGERKGKLIVGGEELDPEEIQERVQKTVKEGSGSECTKS